MNISNFLNKKKHKQKWQFQSIKTVYFVFFIIALCCFAFYIFSTIWNEYNKELYDENLNSEKLLAKNVAIPKWIWNSDSPWWAFPFYFTTQSNFLVLIYFFLMFWGYIVPTKKKSHAIFEAIVLINIFVTMIIFWILIVPLIDQESSGKNYFFVIQTFLSHLIVPLMMIFLYFYRIAKFQYEFSITYKDWWKFLIYPTIYFVFVFILYFATLKENRSYIKILNFKNAVEAEKWQTLKNSEIKEYANYVDDYSIMNISPETLLIQIKISSGIAIYPFLQIHYNGAILSLMYFTIIFFVFISITFLTISMENKKYKVNKWYKNIINWKYTKNKK